MDIADCVTKVYIECFYMLYYRYKKYLKMEQEKKMKIATKNIGSGSFRVPREMIGAVGETCGMIIFGNVVVLTREKHEVPSTLKALRTIIRMIETAAELEAEEAGED